MENKIELYEVKGPNGKTYSFRKMSLGDKLRYNRIALHRVRQEFKKIDAKSEEVVFNAALQNELQFIILVNTLMKADGMTEGEKVTEESVETLVDSADYEQLNIFINKINYPSPEVKKNLENSSSKTEELEIQK